MFHMLAMYRGMRVGPIPDLIVCPGLNFVQRVDHQRGVDGTETGDTPNIVSVQGANLIGRQMTTRFDPEVPTQSVYGQPHSATFRIPCSRVAISVFVRFTTS